MKQSGLMGGACGAVLALVGLLTGCGSSSDGGSSQAAAGSTANNGGSAANSGGATASNAGSTASGGSSAGAAQAGTGGASSGGASTGAGSPPPAKGLGTACASDADCTAPLTCRVDTTDYTADMQCTLPCQSDDTCTTPFGQDSFCIGANICVHACTTDADCSDKTHCNDAGWCERTGPGSGVPYCTGIATPCAGQTELGCIQTSGCTNNAQCTGLVDDCFSQFDDYSCTSLQGCFWDSLAMECSGSAQSCDEMLGDLSCTSQRGCTWSGGCTGVPDACDKQFPSLCTNQPGCTLQTD